MSMQCYEGFDQHKKIRFHPDGTPERRSKVIYVFLVRSSDNEGRSEMGE